MTTETTMRTHTIDAAGKRLGKVATEAATVLMGKDQVDFAKHTVADVQVIIENASKLDIPEKKKGEIYQSYSGYPGGRSTETLEHLGERLGYSEVVRRTVKGMLPKNKLQAVLMKNLIVTE
ncbi:50S ribosomal protein L13 [bacterium]|nr:50S ribosomal protein L13 [bacterium]|tara:strand:+ start:172 stop:534 length:363 start_codon:yes stop_codon:yes gene_type:complete